MQNTLTEEVAAWINDLLVHRDDVYDVGMSFAMIEGHADLADGLMKQHEEFGRLLAAIPHDILDALVALQDAAESDTM